MKNRNYREGVPQHVYFRGKDSGIVFYCIQDCIYFLTLYTVLAEKHGMTTSAFTIMPNHCHAQQNPVSRGSFTAFNSDLSATYTRGYNEWHGRHGKLFDNPFGSSSKPTGKLIKSNLSYICNNGAEGRLSKGILDYRWNMMAYFNNPAPFSERIRRDRISKRLMDAIKMVDYFRAAGRPLGYRTQETIFRKLDKEERKQLTDYILFRYNPVDYSGIELMFGSVSKALEGMEANCGAEHDIKEDWDDYSVYTRIGSAARKKGIRLERVNFETMDAGQLKELRAYLKRTAHATDRQLDKYLHMNTVLSRTISQDTGPTPFQDVQDSIPPK